MSNFHNGWSLRCSWEKVHQNSVSFFSQHLSRYCQWLVPSSALLLYSLFSLCASVNCSTCGCLCVWLTDCPLLTQFNSQSAECLSPLSTASAVASLVDVYSGGCCSSWENIKQSRCFSEVILITWRPHQISYFGITVIKKIVHHSFLILNSEPR